MASPASAIPTMLPTTCARVFDLLSRRRLWMMWRGKAESMGRKPVRKQPRRSPQQPRTSWFYQQPFCRDERSFLSPLWAGAERETRTQENTTFVEGPNVAQRHTAVGSIVDSVARDTSQRLVENCYYCCYIRQLQLRIIQRPSHDFTGGRETQTRIQRKKESRTQVHFQPLHGPTLHALVAQHGVQERCKRTAVHRHHAAGGGGVPHVWESAHFGVHVTAGWFHSLKNCDLVGRGSI